MLCAFRAAQEQLWEWGLAPVKERGPGAHRSQMWPPAVRIGKNTLISQAGTRGPRELHGLCRISQVRGRLRAFPLTGFGMF